MAGKCDQIGIAVSDGALGGVGLKGAGGDDRAAEQLSQLLSRYRSLAHDGEVDALHSGFDDVQIGGSVVVEPRRDMSEKPLGGAVAHAVVVAAWRDAHADAIGAPYRAHRLEEFEEQSCSILDRSAVAVGALIGAVLKKLIDQITVGCVKFDSVESGRPGVVGGGAEFFDDYSDFVDL